MAQLNTLRDILTHIRTVSVRHGGPPVEHTVAERIIRELAPQATLSASDVPPAEEVAARLHISSTDPQSAAPSAPDWMRLKISSNLSAHLAVSDPHWLYPFSSLILDEWLDRSAEDFLEGQSLHPAFSWLRNLSDFFVGSLRSARHFDREAYVRQVARAGFTHITINGLGVDRAYESGPPGDVYSWFYDYSPDLDQFVDSELLRGYYPPDYLQANAFALQRNAALARAYGLTPGFLINSPRSMPEEFWGRYGFLRGARVDHPRETLRPRYTLAMAHPVVQAHYRDLVRKIMAMIPDLGFIHVWTNDSGAGFEFVSSLYAGRNGGPYLLREWKSDDEIARAAAGNVLTYYRLLCDEAKKVNHAFRLICDLGPFYAERKYLIPSLGKGIDAGAYGSFEGPEGGQDPTTRLPEGALNHRKLDLADNNVLGIPSPWLVSERLRAARETGCVAVLAGLVPGSLAPYDVNGEVLRNAQLHPHTPLDTVLTMAAHRWAGSSGAQTLVETWRLAEEAVRAFPRSVPYTTFAFPWFRLWVRPFVPNIDTIPERERSYYERFLLATFNNPARVDFNNDMMWNFLTVPEAAATKQRFDEEVLPKLDLAISRCGDRTERVFGDLHDRLVAYRCFCTTMRNTMAWTESVHGYLAARGDTKTKYRSLCREMVEHEMSNAKAFLQLLRQSSVDFMPVSTTCETLHIYGENVEELVENKIRLMEAHIDDEPYIDPAYMWRMPGHATARVP